MAIPAFLRPIIGWFSHYISRGLSAIGLLPTARERFPGLEPGSLEQAAELGGAAVETAARANLLSPDEPLANALAGREPPDALVETRTLVSLRDQAGGVDDMLLRVTVPWGATFGELLQILESMIVDRLAQSPGLAVVDLDIVPPLLLPPQ